MNFRGSNADLDFKQQTRILYGYIQGAAGKEKPRSAAAAVVVQSDPLMPEQILRDIQQLRERHARHSNTSADRLRSHLSSNRNAQLTVVDRQPCGRGGARENSTDSVQ
jgi:hypothetical protein